MKPNCKKTGSRKNYNPHFWIIIFIFAACIFLHYPKIFYLVPSLELLSLLGLERHALIRILFIAPIAYSAFQFGVKGGVLSTATAVIVMLPRVIFISQYPKDALFETIMTAGIGSLIIIWFSSRQKALTVKELAITELESMQKELRRVGERFQEIFEKANDAIWIQHISGTILLANEACETVTGYEKMKLINENAYSLFLADRSNEMRLVEQSLLEGNEVRQPYEQIIRRKDGTAVAAMVTTSLLGDAQMHAYLHIARDVTGERKLQQSLKEYAQQISKAHEEERKRIARDLHDDTVQTLAGISRLLDNFISKQNGLTEKAAKELDSIKIQSDDALRRTRTFIQNLRPPILEYVGLIPALRELSDNMREQSGMNILFCATGSETTLTPEEKLLVFRIAQEALWNAVKYSKATEVRLSAVFENTELTLCVNDNGIGFIQKQDEELLEDGKLGLIGMLERAELLKGELKIISHPGKGSSMSLSMPLKGKVIT